MKKKKSANKAAKAVHQTLLELTVMDDLRQNPLMDQFCVPSVFLSLFSDQSKLLSSYSNSQFLTITISGSSY